MTGIFNRRRNNSNQAEWSYPKPNLFKRGPKHLIIFAILATVFYIWSLVAFLQKKCPKNPDPNKECTSHRTMAYITLGIASLFTILFIIQAVVNVTGPRYSTSQMQTGYYEDDVEYTHVYDNTTQHFDSDLDEDDCIQ